MPKGFFASLFDISFSSLITTKVIKVLYVLALIGIGIVALFFIVGAFTRSTGAGLLTLVILAPLASLFYVVYTRVVLEFIIVVFRISEHSAELVALQRQQMGLPAAPGGTLGPLATTPTTASPPPPPAPPPPAPPTPAPPAPTSPAQRTAAPETTVVRPVQTPPPSTTPPTMSPESPPPGDAGGGSGSGSAS